MQPDDMAVPEKDKRIRTLAVIDDDMSWCGDLHSTGCVFNKVLDALL